MYACECPCASLARACLNVTEAFNPLGSSRFFSSTIIFQPYPRFLLKMFDLLCILKGVTHQLTEFCFKSPIGFKFSCLGVATDTPLFFNMNNNRVSSNSSSSSSINNSSTYSSRVNKKSFLGKIET